jgi:hypothetical protein
MARKPTKAEARKKLAKLPTPPPFLGKIPGAPGLATRVIRAGQGLAGLLIEVDPLNRTAPLPPVSSPTPPPIQKEVNNMNRNEVVRAMVNDPGIKLTPEMVEIVNDDTLMIADNGQLMAPIGRASSSARFDFNEEGKKKKRKVSKYQKLLGKNLKALKRKHPRTKVTALMKRAHRMTRKALK